MYMLKLVLSGIIIFVLGLKFREKRLQNGITDCEYGADCGKPHEY